MDNKILRKFMYKFLISKINIAIICLTIIAGAWGIYNSDKNFGITIEDMFISISYGVSTNSFNIIGMLRLFVYNVIPIYMVCAFLNYLNDDLYIPLIIRTKEIKNWRKNIIIVSETFIISYVLFFAVINCGILELLKFVDTGVFEKINCLLVLRYIIIKICELTFIFLFVFIMTIFFNNQMLNLMTVIMGYLISTFNYKFIKYIPFGIGNFGRHIEYATDNGIKYEMALIELVILNIVIIFLVKKIISRTKNYF